MKLDVGDTFEYKYEADPVNGYWRGPLVVDRVVNEDDVQAKSLVGGGIGQFSPSMRVNEKLNLKVGDKVTTVDDSIYNNGILIGVIVSNDGSDFAPWQVHDLKDGDDEYWFNTDELQRRDEHELDEYANIWLDSVPNCKCSLDNVTISIVNEDGSETLIENWGNFDMLTDEPIHDEFGTNQEIASLLLKQTYEERMEFVELLRFAVVDLATPGNITDAIMAEALSDVAKELLS